MTCSADLDSYTFSSVHTVKLPGQLWLLKKTKKKKKPHAAAHSHSTRNNPTHWTWSNFVFHLFRAASCQTDCLLSEIIRHKLLASHRFARETRRQLMSSWQPTRDVCRNTSSGQKSVRRRSISNVICTSGRQLLIVFITHIHYLSFVLLQLVLHNPRKLKIVEDSKSHLAYSHERKNQRSWRWICFDA